MANNYDKEAAKKLEQLTRNVKKLQQQLKVIAPVAAAPIDQPIKARPDVSHASLEILVSTRYAWGKRMPYPALVDPPDPKPVKTPVRVTIELTSGGGGASFGDSKDAVAGMAKWDEIPVGEYSIVVAVPQGF